MNIARGLIPALCGLLLLGVLGSAPAHAVESTPPDQLVRETTQEVLSRLERQRKELEQSTEKLYDLIQDEVLPHFDFERISRWVLGKYWRQASPEQQKRFTEEFEQLLIRTYGTALLEYAGQDIEYKPLRMASGSNDATVNTEVRGNSGGPPIDINYRLHKDRDGQWKVYDVSIDGVSLVANYRSSFGSEISRSGLDHLIQSLAERNASPEAPEVPGATSGS